jgi:hypothetical protein
MSFKTLLGNLSPAYGAITGEGMFGNIAGVKSEKRAAANAVASEEEKKKRDAQYMAVTGKPAPYKKGGAVKSDLKQDKSMIKSALHKHEKAMHPGKPMTKLRHGGSASSRADGIAQQGKTRGKCL